VAGALLVALAVYGVLRRIRRRGAEDPQRDTTAVAGSRKAGRAPHPDSEDPLERIESHVVAREGDR
jgi:hypothetical protein